MTLTTQVFVGGGVTHREVFEFCQGMLGAPIDAQRSEDIAWLGGRVLWNTPGQGFPAWVAVEYSPAGPLRSDADACCAGCQQDEDYHYHMPAHNTCAWFDTGYGYASEDGKGCGDLHAVYVAKLGTWLDERGVSWAWKNEFTGQINSGAEKYERLQDLCSDGARAAAWFQRDVLPAIERVVP